MPGIFDHLPHLRRGTRTRRISSYDRSGGNQDSIRIEQGEKKSIAEIEGPGSIKHIWITVSAPDPLIRRNAILRAYWDGEEAPSVEAPLGDFFGQGWGERYSFVSLPLAAAPARGNALNSYFSMPFARHARIEIENESEQPIEAFYYYIDHEVYDAPLSTQIGYFHAFWNRQMPGPQSVQTDRENEGSLLGVEPKNPSDEFNHVFLNATGAGHYVGMNYYVDCPTPLWYGEGDDMFLIDGEPWPGSLHGTGTEDYFNSAWCPKEIYLHPYFGYARINAGETGFLGRTHCYRFHIEDPIYFETSIRGSIEHGHANCLTLDLATVAYWYQTEPHQPFPSLLEKAKRQPMPPLGGIQIHQWRDAWRREMGGGPLWGDEGIPDAQRLR